MKRLRAFVPVFIVVLLLAACGPKATEAPATPEPATEPPATEPAASEVAATQPATVAPAVLANPPMEVGSKYFFIDGGWLVAVPGGPFTMGDGGPENPKREASIDEVWMHQTEVTNRMYGFCVAIGQCSAPDPQDNPSFSDPLFANRPVVGVTYDQAATYCHAFKMRLPTEAEWEKAASWDPAAQVQLTWPWGEKQPSCTLENASTCAGKTTDITVHPDGASPYLAVDMAGNVAEWVADWFSRTYPADAPSANPAGPDAGTRRVVKSTPFDTAFFDTAVAKRWSEVPNAHRDDLGFRCVTTDPFVFAPYCEQLALTGLGPDGQPTGNPPGGQCVPPTINPVPQCEGPTIVNFDPPGGVYNAPGCTPTGNPDQYLCDPADNPGPLSGCGPCTLTDPGDWGCPPHYNKVGAICQWDGSGTSGGECLPGYNFDPATQCCSATPGSAPDLGCPAGWFPFMDGCSSNWNGVPLCKGPVDIPYDLDCGGDDTPCNPATNPNGCEPGGGCPAPCYIAPGSNRCVGPNGGACPY